MNADKDHSLDPLRFNVPAHAATIKGSGKWWLGASFGNESACIGVHRRFLNSFGEGLRSNPERLEIP
jgi:hypothetical protein